MTKEENNIFDYITTQENAYQNSIPLNDSWNWSMKDHIKTTVLYSNGQLLRGMDENKPIKNIIRPILNLQHRVEDIELRDVQLFVEDPNKRHLSFLVKKYHDDVFVKDNDLDAFFDELNVSRIDFGGGLSKMTDAPEVVHLQSIAFADQTDMLSGPIALKHFYSPDQLLAMSKVGWGNKESGATVSLQEVIMLSQAEKQVDKMQGQITKTPGRYIEVYEVHGNLPKKFADPADTSGEYETRIFIVCFYNSLKSDKREGIILYTAPEKELPFKLIKRDPIWGRALGMGGAEELFEPQVWVNYSMIHRKSMMDSASKTIIVSNDPAVAQRSNLRNLKNLDIISEQTNGNTRQLDTYPRNINIFENDVEMWENHAQQMGAANDSIMGQSPTAGTPFKLQELVTQESRGLHEYRRGQFARHIEEIYDEWIIPQIEKKITAGVSFLSELSMDELQYVTDCIIRNKIAETKKERVLNGEDITTSEEDQLLEQRIRDEFHQLGPKLFLEILKGEFKGERLVVKVSVAGKSKQLSAMVDKLTNIFRFVFANPQGFTQTMQIPGMAASFNNILEYSGIDPIDFSNMKQLATPQPSPVQPQQAPQLIQNA